MIRRPPRSTLFPLHDALPISIILLTSSLTAVLGLSFANAGSKNGLLASLITTLARSEEHTSELQSRLHLVCRLLLEKKKTLISPVRPRTRLLLARRQMPESHR